MVKYHDGYENGGHAYHATMPTDGLKQLGGYFAWRQSRLATITPKQAQNQAWSRDFGQHLHKKGVHSVADPSAQAYGVIVCHALGDEIHKGAAFAKVGCPPQLAHRFRLVSQARL